jgi:hypothetical protein
MIDEASRKRAEHVLARSQAAAGHRSSPSG